MATGTTPAPRRRSRLNRAGFGWILLFIGPTVLGLSIGTLGPMIASLVISFTKWDVIVPPDFVGGANYARLAADPLFVKSMINTFYYTAISVPLGMVISLLIAMAMNQKLKGILGYRTAFFAPVVTSVDRKSVV